MRLDITKLIYEYIELFRERPLGILLNPRDYLRFKQELLNQNPHLNSNYTEPIQYEGVSIFSKAYGYPEWLLRLEDIAHLNYLQLKNGEQPKLERVK